MKFLKNTYVYLALFPLILGKTTQVFAQQDVQLSQYMFNTIAFNPAYAGSADLFNATALYRAQWTGFKGSPNTQVITANSPLKNKKLAMGGSLFNDDIGSAHSYGLSVDFAYRILFRNSQLAFGTKVGFEVFQGNFTEVIINDPNDQSFASNVNKFLPNVGFGAYYYGERFYVGLSAPKLVTNKIYDQLPGTISRGKQSISTYLTGGYVFYFNKWLAFKPSVLFKFVENAPASIDINANFLFIDRLWVGALYRPGVAWGVMLQVNITQRFRFGYSLDMSTQEIQSYNNGTHEFMLSYDFVPKKLKFTSPRYF